jgi:hypothetical protein
MIMYFFGLTDSTNFSDTVEMFSWYIVGSNIAIQKQCSSGLIKILLGIIKKVEEIDVCAPLYFMFLSSIFFV